MGYIRIKHRAMLNAIDSLYNYNIPDNWDDFVNKIADKNFNLIIKKSKGQCVCTNCKHEFVTQKKIEEYDKCPNCKNTYKIKRSNLKRYFFEDIAILVDKVDEQLVLRLFEITSTYNTNYGFRVSSVEYARKILLENYTFINDRVSRGTGAFYVHHYHNPGEWRLYTRYYGLSTKGYVYTDNLQEILQGTEYQYSMIWELAKHIKRLDIQKVFRNAKYSNKVEMLTKAKLYNLAMEAEQLYGSGNFEKIFGVPKNLYSFMKKYNITYNQLQILKILKESNIKKLRYLEKYNVASLCDICKYISINRFIKYAKLHRSKVDTHLYADYLRFASLLGFDLKDNRTAFPTDLRGLHDEYAKQYKIQEQELINKAIRKRGKILSMNAYKTKKFMIQPAPTLKALLDESEQQHNCVRTYAEDYASGECDIYFMRDVKEPDKSLVTVEVNGNKIVQSRIKYNNLPTNEQQKFLEKWEQKILKGAA